MLLAPPIEADAIIVKRDTKSAELMPKPGERPAGYLRRLYGGPLATTAGRSCRLPGTARVFEQRPPLDAGYGDSIEDRAHERV